MEQVMKPILKVAIGICIVVVAAGLGIYLGKLFQNNNAVQASQEMDVFKNLSLLPNTHLPGVLVEDTNLNFVPCDELVPEDGAVILFVDAGCPPCSDMISQWQSAIDAGVLRNDQVIGIAYGDELNTAESRAEKNFTFAVYVDAQYDFMRQSGVDGFPLVVAVRGGGRIVYSETNVIKMKSPREVVALIKN